MMLLQTQSLVSIPLDTDNIDMHIDNIDMHIDNTDMNTVDMLAIQK